MELHQLARAIKSHKGVAIGGVLAAILLAVLAQVRVSPFGDPMFTYRRHAVWSSKITVQLTQQGFPEGRVLQGGEQRDTLVALAPLYARLANTDQVRARMRRLGPIRGGIKIVPLVDDNQSSLPLLELRSFAFAKSSAESRVKRQADAFIGYIEAQQRANGVNPKNRVLLKTVKGPSSPKVVVPRKVTLSIVVFLAMLVVTGGVILALENLKRRGPKAALAGAEERPPLEAIAPTREAEAPAKDEARRGPARGEPAVGQAEDAAAAAAAGGAGLSVAPSRPMRTLRSGSDQSAPSTSGNEDGSQDGHGSRSRDDAHQRSRASGRRNR